MARPFRYTFILALVALGTALAAVGGWRYARASAPVNGPIILITVDALRADRLPVYGYSAVRTPAIDALADDGIVFERAYSHAAQTLPAHTSLLSGRLPFDTGVRGNAGFVVPGSARMLAEMLSDRGYDTGAIVSSYVLRRNTGIAQGFSFFDDGTTPSAETAAARLQRDGLESVIIAENWLGSADTSRAFLFLHLYEPHKPYEPPSRFADYDAYDGEVAYADEIVGHLVKYLKAHQLYDRSTIILAADHGEGLGDHGEQEHGLFVYEEAVRVPLVIKPAADAGGGRRIRDLVQHIDIVPTVLDLANAPVPGGIHGRSLRPLFEGDGPLEQQPVYSESLYGRHHFGWSGLTSITDGRYRYISAPREELYDLELDPLQRRNLAAVDPRTTAGMRAALARILEDAPERPAPRPSAEELERLPILGYVGWRTIVAPRDELQDPKDKIAVVEAYREAFERAGAREWRRAIDRLEPLTVPAGTSDAIDAWRQIGAFAAAAGRPDQAADAYRRVLAAEPRDTAAHIAAADVLLGLRRLDEARQHASRAAALTADTVGDARAAAHALLARIALARRDNDAARREAVLAQEYDPARPYVAFVDGQLLLRQDRLEAASAAFEKALEHLAESKGRPMPELLYFAAEALLRSGRTAAAERLLAGELQHFPANLRAHASLATLYHETDRPDAAARALADLVRMIPTADGYALSARLWTSFGNPRQAAAVRAEGRRMLSGPAPAVTGAGQH